MIIWEGPSAYDSSPIVAILTGLERPSQNRKTGAMAQLWILRQDVAPLDAIRTGADDAICGTCPLRGDGTGKGRACYVNVGQAPTSVWHAYRRGSYDWIADLDEAARLLADHSIRLGAYGDPAMLPFHVVQRLALAAIGWTGYSHQWRKLDPKWAQYLMASADTVADRRDARAAGWRSFYVVPMGTDLDAIPHAVECAATRSRTPLKCNACFMCHGTRDSGHVGVDVVIEAHGAGAKYVSV